MNNVAHKLGVKHAQWIASLKPDTDEKACDLHDLYYPFITDDWFGTDAMHDDYWTAFWITLEEMTQ